MGVVLGVVAHGVNVARIVCDGVAVGVRPDVVRAWLIRARGVPVGDDGAPIGLPEAVEGVAVVCCCSSVGIVSVAAALLLMCWRGGRHGSRAKEEQGKERKGKKKRTARKRNKKKARARVGLCASITPYI